MRLISIHNRMLQKQYWVGPLKIAIAVLTPCPCHVWVTVSPNSYFNFLSVLSSMIFLEVQG